MRDYLRCTDLARIPEEIIALYDDGSANDGELVYVPRSAGADHSALSAVTEK
jgi:hypothetical protein